MFTFHININADIRLHDHRDNRISQILANQEQIMATEAQLNEKIDALLVNQNESADEVARIGTLITEIRAQLADGLSPEATAALDARLEAAVNRTQEVETSLRTTV